jgi:uncharacterized membrane protein YvbJ
MKFCVKCGQQLEDLEAVCKNCGLVQPYFPPDMPAATKRDISSRSGATLYLVWSIILIFLLNPVGTPLGIISTFFAASANSQDSDEEAQKKLRVSKILCITATCADAVTLCLLIFYIAFTIAHLGPEFFRNLPNYYNG